MDFDWDLPHNSWWCLEISLSGNTISQPKKPFQTRKKAEKTFLSNNQRSLSRNVIFRCAAVAGTICENVSSVRGVEHGRTMKHETVAKMYLPLVFPFLVLLCVHLKISSSSSMLSPSPSCSIPCNSKTAEQKYVSPDDFFFWWENYDEFLNSG